MGAELAYLGSVLSYLENAEEIDDIDALRKELEEGGYVRRRKIPGGFKEKNIRQSHTNMSCPAVPRCWWEGTTRRMISLHSSFHPQRTYGSTPRIFPDLMSYCEDLTKLHMNQMKNYLRSRFHSSILQQSQRI